MRITLFLAVLTVFLSSCDPCRRLTKKCPPSVQDSIIEIITLDTLILTSPAETLKIEIPFEFDLSDIIEIESGTTEGPKLDLKISDGRLEAQVICPEDSLKAIIAELETRQSTTKIVKEYVDVPRTPRIFWYILIYAILLTAYEAARIYIKIKGSPFKRKLF